MSTPPNNSDRILDWALFIAEAFFAFTYVLGALLRCDWLRGSSACALLIGLLVIVFANSFLIARCLLRLFRATSKLLLPTNEIPDFTKRIIIWLIVGVVAVPAFPFLLALLLDNNWLKHVSWPALLAGFAIAATAILILLIRWAGRTVLFLFKAIRWFYRWFTLRRVFLILMGLVVLVLVFYAEEDVRGWWAWHQFKHKWEARGERFDYASIVPPPVPDDENFALTPIVASCYEWALTKDGRRITPFRTNVVDRLRMNIYHWPPGDTVSGIQPTNGDWRVGKMCDLKSWQAYYRTPFTNVFWFTETNFGSYWKPVTNPGSILTNDFAFPPTPRSPAADVLLALSKYNSTIEDLRKASALPYSRFPLNYGDMEPDSTNPPVVLLMHLAPIKSCIQVLNLRAIAELENDQSGEALDDVKLELRLVDATRVEPILLSHLYRTEEVKILFQAVWEGLAKHKWTDAQLAAIEQELGKMDFLADNQLALRGERNESLALVDYYRKKRPYHEFRQMFSPAFVNPGGMSPGPDDLPRIEREETIAAIVCCSIPGGWFYQNKVIIGQAYQQWWLNVTDPAKHETFPQIQEAGSKFVGSLPHKYWNWLARDFLRGSFATTIRLCYAQETTDLARIACALERYRLAHGEYPESLDALTSQFIDKIPHDIIGGQPLHYHRTDKGRFLLYSVGWNERDDGGKIGMVEGFNQLDIMKGDWVWPFPKQ